MRIPLLTSLFVVSLTLSAHARLGETPDQLTARYGQHLSEFDQKAEGAKVAVAYVVFQKNGIQINVTISNGISAAESFKKLNGQAFTLAEVRTLLSDNSEGRGWEAPDTIQGEKVWARDDGSTARLARDGSLTIKSKELADEEASAKKLERTPSLDGF